MAKSRKDIQIEGQLSLFDFLKPECTFSGHTCNKENLWTLAHTFDDIECPETCCRNCNVRLCGVRCNGSKEPEIQESFMNEPIYELDIRGICDDPYCPKCGRGFWTESKRSEVDCERCPDCHIKIDWSLWHRLNDEE